MAQTPSKRRKMRPNNAIALERAKHKISKGICKDDKALSSNTIHSKKNSDIIETKSKANISASDSDETDNETTRMCSQATQKNRPTFQKRRRFKAETTKDGDSSSTSDSDNTDKADKPSKKAKAEHIAEGAVRKDAEFNKQNKVVVSASDSDETGDDEQLIKPETNSADDKLRLTPRTKKYIHDSSDEATSNEADSDDAVNANSTPRIGLFRESVVKRNHLVGNRLSFRRRGEYDNSKPAAVNLSNRLNDTFLPEVQQDFFVSDSDSEPDSGEDYETRVFPTWQRSLTWNRNPEKDPWPKQRKFGYSDKLKLEKRIKKICRRENITFKTAREIFSGSHRNQYLSFFQKIAVAVPNMPLYLLVKRLKETYHIKRNSSPWTIAEIEQLERLLKIHGNNAELLSTMMDRSPKNINDFISNHKVGTKSSKQWTREEDELLAKVMAKEKQNAAGRASFLEAGRFFKGERSQKQIYARYYNIRHRIQPDGTLVDKRPATVTEELEYLQSLLKQVNDHDLVEESQLDYSKERGFVKASFYLNNRTNIKGFEKMAIKDILNALISRQQTIIESRKRESIN